MRSGGRQRRPAPMAEEQVGKAAKAEGAEGLRRREEPRKRGEKNAQRGDGRGGEERGVKQPGGPKTGPARRIRKVDGTQGLRRKKMRDKM